MDIDNVQTNQTDQTNQSQSSQSSQESSNKPAIASVSSLVVEAPTSDDDKTTTTVDSNTSNSNNTPSTLTQNLTIEDDVTQIEIENENDDDDDDNDNNNMHNNNINDLNHNINHNINNNINNNNNTMDNTNIINHNNTMDDDNDNNDNNNQTKINDNNVDNINTNTNTNTITNHVDIKQNNDNDNDKNDTIINGNNSPLPLQIDKDDNQNNNDNDNSTNNSNDNNSDQNIDIKKDEDGDISMSDKPDQPQINGNGDANQINHNLNNNINNDINNNINQPNHINNQIQINNQNQMNNNNDGDDDDDDDEKPDGRVIKDDNIPMIITKQQPTNTNNDQNQDEDEEVWPSDPCGVCWVGHAYLDDQLVYCDGCDVAIHQSCYCVTDIPEGDWFCKVCLADVANNNNQALPSPSDYYGRKCKCSICQLRFRSKKLAYTSQKNDDPSAKHKSSKHKSKWCHLVCAQYISETWFDEHDTNLNGVCNIHGIRSKRYDGECIYCKRTKGAKVFCSIMGCQTKFHASCGLVNKCTLLDVADPQAEYSNRVVYCQIHSPSIIRNTGNAHLKKRLAESQNITINGNQNNLGWGTTWDDKMNTFYNNNNNNNTTSRNNKIDIDIDSDHNNQLDVDYKAPAGSERKKRKKAKKKLKKKKVKDNTHNSNNNNARILKKDGKIIDKSRRKHDKKIPRKIMANKYLPNNSFGAPPPLTPVFTRRSGFFHTASKSTGPRSGGSGPGPGLGRIKKKFASNYKKRKEAPNSNNIHQPPNKKQRISPPMYNNNNNNIINQIQPPKKVNPNHIPKRRYPKYTNPLNNLSNLNNNKNNSNNNNNERDKVHNHTMSSHRVDAKELLARSQPKQFEQVGKMRIIKPTRKLQQRIQRNNNNNSNNSMHHPQQQQQQVFQQPPPNIIPPTIPSNQSMSSISNKSQPQPQPPQGQGQGQGQVVPISMKPQYQVFPRRPNEIWSTKMLHERESNTHSGITSDMSHLDFGVTFVWKAGCQMEWPFSNISSTPASELQAIHCSWKKEFSEIEKYMSEIRPGGKKQHLSHHWMLCEIHPYSTDDVGCYGDFCNYYKDLGKVSAAMVKSDKHAHLLFYLCPPDESILPSSYLDDIFNISMPKGLLWCLIFIKNLDKDKDSNDKNKIINKQSKSSKDPRNKSNTKDPRSISNKDPRFNQKKNVKNVKNQKKNQKKEDKEREKKRKEKERRREREREKEKKKLLKQKEKEKLKKDKKNINIHKKENKKEKEKEKSISLGVEVESEGLLGLLEELGDELKNETNIKNDVKNNLNNDDNVKDNKDNDNKNQNSNSNEPQIVLTNSQEF